MNPVSKKSLAKIQKFLNEAGKGRSSEWNGTVKERGVDKYHVTFNGEHVFRLIPVSIEEYKSLPPLRKHCENGCDIYKTEEVSVRFYLEK
jgi:hypothetical protein